MMTDRSILRLALLGAAAVVLSACGGSSPTTVTGVSVPEPFAYQFGQGFGTDFYAGANNTPAPLSGSELSAVSLTAAPTPFPAGTVGSN